LIVQHCNAGAHLVDMIQQLRAPAFQKRKRAAQIGSFHTA